MPRHVLRQNIYHNALDHSNQVIPSTRAEKVKDLGAWFDKNLSFKDQVHDKINIAYRMLQGPDKTKFYKTFNRVRLYKSMVRSHLAYTAVLFGHRIEKGI